MNIDFSKLNGLVPAIVQDDQTRKVLMLGFMNDEAFAKTQETGLVTFLAVLKIACGPKEKKVETF